MSKFISQRLSCFIGLFSWLVLIIFWNLKHDIPVVLVDESAYLLNAMVSTNAIPEHFLSIEGITNTLNWFFWHRDWKPLGHTFVHDMFAWVVGPDAFLISYCTSSKHLAQIG